MTSVYMVKSQKQILSKETRKIMKKKKEIKMKGNEKKKKWNIKKDKNFKICKMSMGGNYTHKTKLVKIFKA